jgi:hypothetical protein
MNEERKRKENNQKRRKKETRTEISKRGIDRKGAR